MDLKKFKGKHEVKQVMENLYNVDQNPLVSICCQTYNHANYIKDALEGFLMQVVDFNYEILLRDDASTDGTAEICKDYAKKYPDKISLLGYKENQFKMGVGPLADNVKRSKGKYIAICEEDYCLSTPGTTKANK